MAIALPGRSGSRVLMGLLAAMLAHAALLLLLLWQRDRHSVTPAAPALIELRLLATPAAVPERSRPTTRAPALTQVPRVAVPITITTPMPELAVTPTPLPTPATVVARPPPLNLSLPPERPASGPRPETMLSRMLNDPRTNSGKRTVESVIADAAGTLPVSTQSSTDGTQSTLIRQGSKCVRVAEARIKTLNPMDDNARGVSSVAGPCFKD